MKKQQAVITFKADEDLLNALGRIPNKSEFIRSALMAALDESCPLCGGTGSLNPHQRLHWTNFLKEHVMEECSECHGIKLSCKKSCHCHTKEKDRSKEETSCSD